MEYIAPILIGKGEEKQYPLPAFGNRHGLITGVTGTGKTVTLLVLTASQAGTLLGREIMRGLLGVIKKCR